MESKPDKYEENRYYFKFQRVIPKSRMTGKDHARSFLRLKIYGVIWLCETSYNDEGMLISLISIIGMPKVVVNVRTGICEASKKIIALSENHQVLKKSDFIKKQIPIDRSELKSIMQTKKVLYFFIEVLENDDGKTQDTKTRKRKIEKDFEEMLFSGLNSDLIIEVSSKKFKCHRNILAARSPVFFAMMAHDMKEKASGIVTIQDVEPTAFQEFLLYLYTGNEDCLNWKNVIELYTLGDKYAVEDLKNLCIERMKQNISTENLLKIFLLSQQCHEPELSKVTIEVFVKNLEEIIETEKWIEFLRNYPSESNILIKAIRKNSH